VLTDTILKGDHTRIISAKFGWIMMSFLTYITGFFMNFELLPILTDYANQKKGGMKFKKNLLLWNYWANLNQTLLKWFLDGPLQKLRLAFQNTDQDGHHSRT
jgi:hypothetical protein